MRAIFKIVGKNLRRRRALRQERVGTDTRFGPSVGRVLNGAFPFGRKSLTGRCHCCDSAIVTQSRVTFQFWNSV